MATPLRFIDGAHRPARLRSAFQLDTTQSISEEMAQKAGGEAVAGEGRIRDNRSKVKIPKGNSSKDNPQTTCLMPGSCARL